MMMRRRRKWRRRRMRRALYLTGLWESCVAAAKVSMVLMCTSLLGMCSTAESCCLSPAQTGVFWFGSSTHGLPPPFHSCPDSALQQRSRVLSIQSLSCVQIYATPWTAARQASLYITNSPNLPRLMPSNYLILSHSLILRPLMFPSIRVFSNESDLRIRWPKYWNLSFSISPSNEYSELISFRMDWLDLLEVQGTLKSLLQHHSSKASILWHSAFFIVQLSHPYMTTGKTVALTRWTFISKVTSLLFNMLSRFVMAFLPRSKCLLISCAQS